MTIDEDGGKKMSLLIIMILTAVAAAAAAAVGRDDVDDDDDDDNNAQDVSPEDARGENLEEWTHRRIKRLALNDLTYFFFLSAFEFCCFCSLPTVLFSALPFYLAF